MNKKIMPDDSEILYQLIRRQSFIAAVLFLMMFIMIIFLFFK